MKHASVFSGIGGPEVAAAMLGWDNLFHCEINPFGRAVLDYWFPDAESYEDITKTNFTKWRGQIDVLTGGFPCQPFSYAGKRNGAEDDRYLWPEMLRVINEVRPTWFVGENVAGIRTMVEQGRILDLGCEPSLFGEDNDLHRYQSEGLFTIERICRNLESAGYSVQPIVIPACAVGAPHRRDRIFFIAHADCGADLRGSREDAGESREERIQERDAVRAADIASDVRGNAKTPCAADAWAGEMKSRGVSGTSGTLAQEIVSGYAAKRMPDLLPIPRSCSSMGANLETEGMVSEKRSPNLEVVIAKQLHAGLLPTPRVNDANLESEELAGREHHNLEEEVAKMLQSGLLPTPTATDYKGPYSEEAMGNNAGRKDLLISLPTHLGTYKKGMRGGISQLSPLFTEEMMGFPLMWTALPFLSQSGETKPSKPTETQ